jgi:hypothetical protein
MRGISNFRLAPECPDRDYVTKNLKGGSKHNSLILDDKNSMSVLSTFNF